MRYQIPEPVLQTVHNETPFRHFHAQKMAPGRVFCDCVVVKGSFRLEAGVAPLADEAAPIVFSDRYHEGRDAAGSSVAEAGDLHLAKPGTDVIVTGTAQAPRGRAAARWPCQVVLQEGTTRLLEHAVTATGPRRWTRRALGGLALGEPDPTLDTPIRYELAYGGRYAERDGADRRPRWVAHRENPSGTGFFDPDRLADADGADGPRWELPSHPVASSNTDSPLAGFGPVARMWSARARFAGTYDAAWEARLRPDQARGLVPDYPADFDPTFFHAAHPKLVHPRPLSSEAFLVLRGLVADAPELPVRLADVRPRIEGLTPAGAWRPLQAPLDTLHVDLDARRVHAVWRLVLHPEDGVGAVAIHAEEGVRS